MKKFLAAVAIALCSAAAHAGVVTDFLVGKVNGGFREPSAAAINKSYPDLSETDRAYILDRVMQDQIEYARRIGAMADDIIERDPKVELRDLQQTLAEAQRGWVSYRSNTYVGGQVVSSFTVRDVNYDFVDALRISIKELKSGMGPATLTLDSNWTGKKVIKTTVGQKRAVMALLDQYDQGFQSLFTQTTKYEAQEADKRNRAAEKAQLLAEIDRKIAALKGCRSTFFVRACREEAADLYNQRVMLTNRQ